MATVLLIRHGQSSANQAGVLAGWTPSVSLTAAGRSQADTVASHVTASADVVRVVSSPLQRCQETAQPLVAATGLDMEIHEGLAECRYGAWTGRCLAELVREPLWTTVQRQPSATVFPDGGGFVGESMLAMSARAAGTVRALDAEVTERHGADAVWCAVSHGDIIKAVLADALGMGLDAFQRITCFPASVSIVRYTEERPYVVTMNATSQLPPLRSSTHATPHDATVGGDTGEPGWQRPERGAAAG